LGCVIIARIHELSRLKSVMSSARNKKSSKTEWIYGFHSAESRIARASNSIVEAYVDNRRRDARMQKLVESLEANGIAYQQVAKRDLSNFVDANHQGVVLKTKSTAQKPEKALYELLDALEHAPLFLVLDQITDPHNLGACLRTADGAGVDAVILPKDGACPINETVRRVASGAAESVNVFYVTNLARSLKELQKRGVWVVGLADTAPQSIFEAELSRPSALVLGAEGKGMRKLTQEHCDQLVSIPMHGSVSSLNVSVATGVVLYSLKP
jgi:23S rRNA (guanosine2251-2'-O)-methyltransferase